MTQDDYKLGNSLNGVATQEYLPATINEITKVKTATTMNYVDSRTTINYDEVVSNKVGDYDV